MRTKMTEEIKQKQYLLLANEIHMALLGRLMPGLMFLQVEGINLKENDSYMVLVNPINPVGAVGTVSPQESNEAAVDESTL